MQERVWRIMWRSRALVAFFSLAGAAGAAERPEIADAWIRATPPGARTGAAYMTLTTDGPADRLVGATTPAAEAVEIHTHVVERGMSRMVRLGELALPAGEPVRLEPGGLHLMLLGLATPLAAGTRIVVTLQFAIAGSVDLEVPVVDARAAVPASHSGH